MRAPERSKLGRSASGAGEAGERSDKQKIHGTSSSCILQRQINHSLNPGLAIRGVTCLSPDSGSKPEEWDSGLVIGVRFWVGTGGGLLVCSYDALEQTLGSGICVSAEGVELQRERLCVCATGRRWECDARLVTPKA